MVHIQHAEFLISAVGPDQYPKTGRPEIVLAGRSNVGKSSFINNLLNRKKLARTSSKPGKTQTLNYYDIEEKFYLVDVPGYGYARVSKSSREKWGAMLNEYFTNREEITLAILLVDIRHKPTEQDVQMKEFFEYCELPYFVVATKLDKIKGSQVNKQLSLIKNTLDLVTVDQILPYSSETNQGRDEMWEIIESVIESENS